MCWSCQQSLGEVDEQKHSPWLKLSLEIPPNGKINNFRVGFRKKKKKSINNNSEKISYCTPSWGEPLEGSGLFAIGGFGKTSQRALPVTPRSHRLVLRDKVS